MAEDSSKLTDIFFNFDLDIKQIYVKTLFDNYLIINILQLTYSQNID